MQINLDLVEKNSKKLKSEALFSYLLGIFMEDIGLWSREALVKLVEDLFGMVQETFYKTGVSARFSNLVKYFNSSVNEKSKVVILGWIFNNQLSFEKLSLLPGFGFTNRFGDVVRGNPEYHSIYEGYTGLKEE